MKRPAVIKVRYAVIILIATALCIFFVNMLIASRLCAQVLDPPPAVPGFDIEWRADLYAKDFVMRDVPIDAIAGRMNKPPFPTRRACEASGYREAPRMVDFITAYMRADGSVRWKCEKGG